MITTDGVRSLKRLHAAKKALAVITDMGLPAKASRIDGFTYKVWQQDGGKLAGGRVVSPAGIFVLYTSADGIRQFVADSFECAAGEIRTAQEAGRYVLAASPLSPAGGNAKTTFTSLPGVSTYRANPIVRAGWKSPRVIATPFAGELCIVDSVLEHNDTPPQMISATSATHCYGRGVYPDDPADAAPAAGFSFARDPLDNTRSRFIRIFALSQYSTYWERMYSKVGFGFTAEGLNGLGRIFVTYFSYYAPTASFAYFHLAIHTLLALAPASIRAKLDAMPSDEAKVSAYQTVGYWSRTPNDITGISAFSYGFIVEGGTDDAALARIANPNSAHIAPADAKWLCTLSFVSLAGVTVTKNADDVAPSVLPLMNTGGELYWIREALGMGSTTGTADMTAVERFALVSRAVELFFGWPAEVETLSSSGSAFTLPRDTVTFHTPDGTVYSWLRSSSPTTVQNVEGGYSTVRGGGFRFSASEATGISRVPLFMPQQVLNDPSLRPCVLLATRDPAPLYYCLTDNKEGEIKGLHVGSPFAGWENIPLPSGATMYAVRMVMPTKAGADSSFIGVGKTTSETGTIYRIYFKPAGGAWVGLSSIPVQGVDDLAASWDVCIFGDDPLAGAMQAVAQCPTAAQPQPPVAR